MQERLAGHGRAAAYASAAALVVFFPFSLLLPAFWAPGSAESWAMAAINDLALWLWIAAFAVVALDIERRLAPAVAVSRWRLARWAIAVSLVAPVVLVLGQVLTSSLLRLLADDLKFVGSLFLVAAYSLIFVGVGIGLVVHNDAARRAGLLQGALPWLGIVTGAGYVLSAIGLWAGGFAWVAPDQLWIVFVVFFDLLLLMQLLYIGWAIWVGNILGRLRAAMPAG